MDLQSEIIDSRDLIAKADEIENEIELLGSADEDDRETLAAIRALEAEGITDWEYGETLIREDYFTTYAQELAEDIGAIDPNASWPLSYIDWEAAAEALKQDYNEVDFLGHTYYVRA